MDIDENSDLKKESSLKKIKNILDEHKLTFLKFALIGFFATVVNYVIFFALFKYFHVNYLLSSAVGYISGVMLGYNFNKKFTFKYQPSTSSLESVKYLIVYSFSLILGLLLLKLLVFIGINVFISNVITIGFTTITNYLGSKYFVFNDNRFNRKINYWIYRYRYLTLYIIIGLSSIILEILIISIIGRNISEFFFKAVIGFIGSLLFSFFLNSTINFKVAKGRNIRTFRMFTIISIFAFVLNLTIINLFLSKYLLLEYSIARIISAGIVFVVSYSLHRKFTFLDIKNVGIAIYLSGSEDVKNIKKKIAYYPDWIHLDLVDQTFKKNANDVEISKGYESKLYWPRLKFMTHIMSKNPSKWIEKVDVFSDYIIVQYEVDEQLDEIINKIKSIHKKVGISLMPNTPIESLSKYYTKLDIIQILGIHNLGESGQQMDESTLLKIKELNEIKSKNKYKFDVCFDGGVKLENIDKIKAKYIVSGSTVLNSEESIKTIFALKTSSKYHDATDKKHKE